MALFDIATKYDVQDLHFKIDPSTGLHAIVAIHSTTLGPALGGCRCISYPTTEAAVTDVCRLAQGMSYKSALNDLPLGGGKSVIIKPAYIRDRKAYFKAFGEFVGQLGGRYITAMDSGTEVKDMDHIATETSFVTCTSKHNGENGDPAPYTAAGVMSGMRAALQSRFDRDDFTNVRIAIQGVGHVGYHLACLLHEAGARLVITDMNQSLVERCLEKVPADVVAPDEIYQTKCDIFSPCALGAILNSTTIPKLNTKIVAGSANNQLASEEDGELLNKRGILYTPDYVINCGGLIHAASQYLQLTDAQTKEKVANTEHILLHIFNESKERNRLPHRIADSIAREKLAQGSAHEHPIPSIPKR